MRYILVFLLLCTATGVPAQQKNIYYPSGLVQYSYQFKDGKLNGDFISYYESGLVKAKGSFANGQKQGIWNAWDTEGVLRSRRNYQGNVSFELLSEWNSAGSAVDAAYLEKKKAVICMPLSFHDEEPIYVQRYWEIIQPAPANNELFKTEVADLVKTQIKAGQLTVFRDDRFVNPVSPTDAETMITGVPDEYILKLDHRYIASRQQMFTVVIGVGMKYKADGEEKIAWLYYPDLKPVLNTIPAIVEKLNEGSFQTTIDMTTWRSKNNQPKKLDDSERVAVLLAETDFEASAWVYLLDKDLKR